MDDKNDLRQDLLGRIEVRRTAVEGFLRQNRPTVRRRTNVTIMLSSLAAVFTAGPALGGKTFAQGVQNVLGLADPSYVWRLLCLAAMLVSVGAAVMANLAKAHEEAAGRLSTAEAAKAELEGLAGLLEYGEMPPEDAVKLFHQYSVKIPFVDDGPAAARPA